VTKKKKKKMVRLAFVIGQRVRSRAVARRRFESAFFSCDLFTRSRTALLLFICLICTLNRSLPARYDQLVLFVNHLFSILSLSLSLSLSLFSSLIIAFVHFDRDLPLQSVRFLPSTRFFFAHLALRIFPAPSLIHSNFRTVLLNFDSIG
jgi:hypothetical protein